MIRRGQTLAIFALTTLLLTLMVMMTLSIASKIRDRIELQTLADASAYSNAVATARSFNTAALLNRTMVSQWAAMCGVAALHSYGSSQAGYYYAFAGAVLEMNDPNPAIQWDGVDRDSADTGTGSGWGACRDGNGYYACQGRWTDDPDTLDCSGGNAATCGGICTVNARGQRRCCSAQYDSSGVYQGCNPTEDCDGLRRKHLAAEASALWAQADQQWSNGYGALDGQVITQAKNLWQAMDDLGRIQRWTHQKLRLMLEQQTLATQLVKLSDPGVQSGMVNVLRGARPANVAQREVLAAAPINAPPGFPSTTTPAPDAHMRAMAMAVAGTRKNALLHTKYRPPNAFNQWMNGSGRVNGAWYPLPNGAFIRYQWPLEARITAHPGAYGQCYGNGGAPYAQSLRSQPGISVPDQFNNNPIDNNQMDEIFRGAGCNGPFGINPGTGTVWRGPAIVREWTGVRATTWFGNLTVTYRPATSGLAAGNTCNQTIGPGPAEDGRTNTTEGQSLVWYTVPVGPEVPRHYFTGHHPSVDEVRGHRDSFRTGPGPNYNAGHPGEISSNAHSIGNSNTDNAVLPDSIGFVFPSLGLQGARGAWGQPKTPVLLQRPLAHKDPWNMLTGMQFSQAGAGAQLDLQKGFKGPVALGNAITYFHRTGAGGRGGWIEAPSFLNPFWRATLVPIDIDERPTQGGAFFQDSTPSYTPGGPPDAVTMLNGMPLPTEAAVYTALKSAGYRGGQ